MHSKINKDQYCVYKRN